ncbi:MAG: hypothetical protein ABSC01_04480 [Verrucomicrobiota bacterium]
MSNAVAGKAGKVFRSELMLVANLNSIRPAGRQVTEKLVELGDEIGPLFVVARIKAGELKDDDPDV